MQRRQVVYRLTIENINIATGRKAVPVKSTRQNKRKEKGGGM